MSIHITRQIKKISFLFLCAGAVILCRPETIRAAEPPAEEESESDTDTYDEMLLTNANDIQIVESSHYDFSNKKITCLGDSITAGAEGAIRNGNYLSWAGYLADILDCEVVNMGIGGSTIAEYEVPNPTIEGIPSFIERWRDIPIDTDIILIMGGLNDYLMAPADFGDPYLRQPHTYCGDTYRLFRNIKRAYPYAAVFVCTTFENGAEYWPMGPEYTHEFSDYMYVQEKYCTELGIYLIDLYKTDFLSSRSEEIKEIFSPHDIHPNDAGYHFLAYRIAAELCCAYDMAMRPDEDNVGNHSRTYQRIQ